MSYNQGESILYINVFIFLESCGNWQPPWMMKKIISSATVLWSYWSLFVLEILGGSLCADGKLINYQGESEKAKIAQKILIHLESLTESKEFKEVGLLMR